MRYLLFFLTFFLSSVCYAALDEVVIRSGDQKCAIHYLTPNPLSGQSFQTNNTCSDGWMQGYGRIEISAPNNSIKEILNGFFMDGYWLGAFPGRGHVQDRTNPQENVQALTYVLDKDEQADITYLVQLRSTRSENGIYGPFTGCPEFRLLVVVKDKNLFQNEAFQEKIATQSLRYGQRLCAHLETIAVFGSMKIDARAPDILFQMQIDVSTKERTIIPVQFDVQISDINHPIELRQQSGDVLLSAEPADKEIILHYGEKPIPKKETPPSSKSIPLTSLNHLNILSKLSNQPAFGRVIVHIQHIGLDGSAQVDIPQPALLKYHPRLKIGWAIVQGYFYQNQIQVSDIKFCQQEWCSDVS